jgi:hypothetical protein
MAAAHGCHGATVEFTGHAQVFDGQGFHDDSPSVN